MADQLFYTYANTGKSLVEAKAKSNAHTYSVVFDKGRSTVLVQGEEFGQGVVDSSYHYTPATDSSAKLDKDASGGSNATFGTTQLVTGVTIQRDAKGHVTDLSLDSIKLPSIPAETDITLAGTKGTNNVVSDVTKDSTSHKLNITYTTVYDTLSGTKGTNNVVTNITGSGKTITVSYGTLPTYQYLANTYQPIGSYAPSSTTLTALKGTYETVGYKVATYHGNSATASYSVNIPAATINNFGVVKLTSDYHYKPSPTSQTATPSNIAEATLNFGDPVITAITYTQDEHGHIGNIQYETSALPEQTNLSLGTNNGGSKVINKLTVSGHTITASYVSLPAEALNGPLKIQVDSDTATTMFTANQATATTSTLKFTSGSYISLSRSTYNVTINHGNPGATDTTKATAAGSVAWSSPVVTAINVDSKGHVSGFTTATMPINPVNDTSLINYSNESYVNGIALTNSNVGTGTGTHGTKITLSYHLGNSSGNTTNTIIPKATNSAYGLVKIKRTSTIQGSTLTESNTTQRYPVSMTVDGFAYVAVPWSSGGTANDGRLQLTDGTTTYNTPFTANASGSIQAIKFSSGQNITIGFEGSTTEAADVRISHDSPTNGTAVTGINNYKPGANATMVRFVSDLHIEKDPNGHITDFAYNYYDMSIDALSGGSGSNSRAITYLDNGNSISNIGPVKNVKVVSTPGTDINTLYIVI